MKKGYMVLLLAVIFCCCGCSLDKKEEVFKLEETTYTELKMQSILKAESITSIGLFYEGVNTYIYDSKELEKLSSNWSKATVSDANVSLLNEELPPGFLYSISFKTKALEGKEEQESTITVISKQRDNIMFTYMSPDGQEHKIVGKLNNSLADFLTNLLESQKNNL